MIAEIPVIAALTSFVAGIASFLSPCVLPLVPGDVSYVADDSLVGARGRDREARVRRMIPGFFLSTEFSTVFIAFGASATGRLLLARHGRQYRYWVLRQLQHDGPLSRIQCIRIAGGAAALPDQHRGGATMWIVDSMMIGVAATITIYRCAPNGERPTGTVSVTSVLASNVAPVRRE